MSKSNSKKPNQIEINREFCTVTELGDSSKKSGYGIQITFDGSNGNGTGELCERIIYLDLKEGLYIEEAHKLMELIRI